MTDVLAKLYELPPLEAALTRVRQSGVEVRRAMAAEKHVVLAWVAEQFYPHWMSECEVTFARQPISCFVAVEQGQIVGFACYDATCKNFFGPTGVDESQRGRGIGAALLLACLHAMSEQGYAYGIIGGVGPVDFYARIVGAIEIPDSTPGIYEEMLSS